jgi:hypothetical protein
VAHANIRLPSVLSGTFVNIARFSSRGGRRLFAKIESMLREGQVNLFFNDAIGQLSAEPGLVSPRRRACLGQKSMT